jgi:hypothetical protein
MIKDVPYAILTASLQFRKEKAFLKNIKGGFIAVSKKIAFRQNIKGEY